MTDNAGNFDLFDPTLLPERPVTGAELQAAFGISGDALRAAVLSGKLLPCCGSQLDAQLFDMVRRTNSRVLSRKVSRGNPQRSGCRQVRTAHVVRDARALIVLK